MPVIRKYKRGEQPPPTPPRVTYPRISRVRATAYLKHYAEDGRIAIEQIAYLKAGPDALIRQERRLLGYGRRVTALGATLGFCVEDEPGVLFKNVGALAEELEERADAKAWNPFDH